MDFTFVQNQMSAEWRNHAAYAAMAAKLYAAKWDGFAAYMEKQSAEELEHYRKFRDFLIDRKQDPVLELELLTLPTIPDGNNPLAHFQTAYELECANTASILALDAMDGTNNEDPERELLEAWLIWAKNEQRVSERDAWDAITEISRVANDPAGMEIMNERYGEK